MVDVKEMITILKQELPVREHVIPIVSVSMYA